jgi:hypothetical protein
VNADEACGRDPRRTGSTGRGFLREDEIDKWEKVITTAGVKVEA